MSATNLTAGHAGPWNPGILSQVPAELRHLSTIFRPDNVSTTVAAADELHDLTGLPPAELVAFRPKRLVLHEILIRITADFAVPDGSRIEDLGINFREITRLVLTRYIEPEMEAVAATFDQVRRQLTDAIDATLCAVPAGSTRASAHEMRSPASRLLPRFTRRRTEALPPAINQSWNIRQIAESERTATTTDDPMKRAANRAVARVTSALFSRHGRAWGTRSLVAALAADIACNDFGSDAIGAAIEPLVMRAAQHEGYEVLRRQQRPIVMNTKGPSASGKSTLRPLQRKLAGDLGVHWSDFALISPDIWRKQLLDYGALGAAYKYAGAFTAEEVQIVDQKLDRHMARKYERGEMSHLLIDRFRFDSFAPDSREAGSNLLTRFGHTVYLFFLITPPELLVERAWRRGLEVGRYKAVDDTLAHGVEAYSGMPDVFFTWVCRADKVVHFEFLDNSVQRGERPRTVAFGSNDGLTVLDVARLLDIERYRRVDVHASAAEFLYPERAILEAEQNTGFLQRCIEQFREVIFADQATGRVYLRIVSGKPVLADREALQQAISNPDTGAGLRAVAPAAFGRTVPLSDRPTYLGGPGVTGHVPTLGQWGTVAGQ
jgi:hypothetical protein